MSRLLLVSPKTVRWGQSAHCSSLPDLGSVAFIQKATRQEDLIQSCDAPLQRGLLEQCCRKWTPQHSYSQGWPASTHLKYTHTCKHIMYTPHTHIRMVQAWYFYSVFYIQLSCQLGHHRLFIHALSHTQAPTSTPNTTVHHTTWGCSYASYTAHIPHSLSCQIMHSPFSYSPISFFKPSHTIITTLHSVTRKKY